MNAPRRYNFFELPKSGKHQEEPFTEPTLVLRVVSGSVDTKDVHEHNLQRRASLRDKMPEKSVAASVGKTLAAESKQTRAAIAEHQRAQNARCELYKSLWEQPQWMLRTALAGSRASKQVEQSLVFKALAAAAAQALVVAAAWRALK